MSDNKVRLLTISEAIELVDGLTKYQIRMMIKNGQLPCIKAGKKIFINRDILIRFLNNEI